jgi:hypothetical protein
MLPPFLTVAMLPSISQGLGSVNSFVGYGEAIFKNLRASWEIRSLRAGERVLGGETGGLGREEIRA